MSVDREHLTGAFNLAHKLAVSDGVPQPQRNQFRAVAHLIWKACGSKDSGVSDPAAKPKWSIHLDRGAGWVSIFESDNEGKTRRRYTEARKKLDNGSIRLMRPDGRTEFIEHLGAAACYAGRGRKRA